MAASASIKSANLTPDNGEKGENIMKGPDDPIKNPDNAGTPQAQEPPAVADEKEEENKDKTPQVDIRQLPMDGVCGGY